MIFLSASESRDGKEDREEMIGKERTQASGPRRLWRLTHRGLMHTPGFPFIPLFLLHSPSLSFLFLSFPPFFFFSLLFLITSSLNLFLPPPPSSLFLSSLSLPLSLSFLPHFYIVSRAMNTAQSLDFQDFIPNSPF